MNKIIISLLITILVSFVFGIIGHFSFGSFSSWFGISFIGQYLFFYIFNAIVDRVENYNYLKMQRDVEIELQKNIMVMPCASCNQPNEVLIDIKSGNNDFKCHSCDTVNSVLVNITNAQKTNILYRKDILTEQDIIDLK